MKNFHNWVKEFKTLPEIQKTIALLKNEVIARHDNKYLSDELEEWVLKACHNAARFDEESKGSYKKARKESKESYHAIRAKGRNPLDMVKSLQNFFKNSGDVADYVGVIVVFHLAKQGIVKGRKKKDNPDTRTILNEILSAIKAGLQHYEIPKGSLQWYQAGCLGFSNPIEQERKQIPIDSLIFELAFHIRNYLSPGPPRVLQMGLSLPGNCRWGKQNQVIATLTNTVLNTSLDSIRVKQRLDFLKKNGVVFFPWNLDM